MVRLPDEDEIAEYRVAKLLPDDMSRKAVIRMMLAEQRFAQARARQTEQVPTSIDGDYVCDGLKTFQDRADKAGIRPEILAAAIPAVASRLVAQSIITPKDTH